MTEMKDTTTLEQDENLYSGTIHQGKIKSIRNNEITETPSTFIVLGWRIRLDMICLDIKSTQSTAQHEDKFAASTKIQIMKIFSDYDSMMTDFRPISVREESKMFILIETNIFELEHDTASDSNPMSAGNEDYPYNNSEGVRPSASANSIGYHHQILYGKG